jgi:hypothetical protein
MSLLRSVSALVAAPALATAAAAQAPAVPAPFGAPPAPIISPVPAVSAPLTPASPLVAPLPPAPSPVGIGAYPPPPGPTTTLWSFLGMSRAQREYRQRAMARTPLGQLRGRIQSPLSRLTGGLIPPFPPETPSLAELQAPGPVGAAAKVKLDRQGAKDRIEAVQYLGTVDCHYWPEAEDALVGALRVDRNEWVRLEAARTLGTGCCCTKKTITALTMAATCSDADGNPAEKSPRVVAAAQQALSRCLSEVCVSPAVIEAPVPVPEPLKESPRELPRELPGDGAAPAAAWSKPAPAGEEKGPGGLPAHQVARPNGQAFYDRVAQRSWREVIAYANHGLANAPPVPAEFATSAAGSDLEVSDLHAVRADRPANLLDMMLGRDNGPVMPTANAIPHYVIHTPAQQSAVQHAPPQVQQAHQPARQPTPPQPAQVQQRPAPEAVPAAVVHTPAPPQAQPQPQPRPAVEPSRIPSSVAGGAAPSVDLFAPKPIEVGMTLPAPPARPVPQASPPPAPVRPSAVNIPTQVARVLTLMQRPSDPQVLAKEIDQISAADVEAYPAVVPVLLRAAEDVTEAPVQSACVRALVRGKANTPGVLAGLQRLTSVRSAEVRIEAAAGLAELKGGEK